MRCKKIIARSAFLNEQDPRVKFCINCGRRIPINSPYDKCKDCMKKELFPKVKEFINENDDVNGMIVAQEFGIERSIVHEWVVEGQKDIWSTRKSLIINQAF